MKKLGIHSVIRKKKKKYISSTPETIAENKLGRDERKESLTKRELPYTIAMVVLDIIAPILLMLGITRTNSANVSLLNNFEIVVLSP